MKNLNYTSINIKKHHREKRKDFYFILILILISFHLIANINWINLNNVPPTWDASLHTILSLRFLEYLKINIFHFNFVDFLKISYYYPPFVHLIGSILGFLSNGNYKVIGLTGTFFFAISIYFLYLYTKELFKNKLIAFFSSFFFSFYITIYQQSRDHMLDIPLIALILGGLYFLEKSEGFLKRRESIIFFLFFSFAFLTKWYSPLFFFIPAINLFINKLKQDKFKILLKNIIIGCFIFIILTAPWYLVNWQRFIEISKVTATAELADPQNLLSLENLFFNLKLIIMFQTTFIGFIFFSFSFFLLIKKIRYRPVWLILSILFINYIIFTIIPNKNIRYTMPLMPFIAMIMACGIQYCFFYKKKLPLILTSYFLVFFYVFSYFILSFGLPIYPSFTYSLNLPLLGMTDILYLNNHPVKVIFDKNYWPNKKILTDILNSLNFVNKERIVLLNLIDRGYLNNYNLDPILYQDLPKKARKIQVVFIPFLEKYKDEKSMRSFLDNEIDFILLPKKYIGLPESIREYDNMLRFKNFILTQKLNNFRVIKKYIISGDYFHPQLFPYDEILLYKKTF